MKNLHPLLIFLFLSLSIYAQSPDKMSYQAVVRDANNTLVANQTVGMIGISSSFNISDF